MNVNTISTGVIIDFQSTGLTGVPHVTAAFE